MHGTANICADTYDNTTIAIPKIPIMGEAMECFNRLLRDFIEVTRSGQVIEAKTEIQRRVLAVLASKAAEQETKTPVHKVQLVSF